MRKVDQTIVSNINGNCLQAAVASLLDLNLEEVPSFIDAKEKWHQLLWMFMSKNGYEDMGWEYATGINPSLLERMKFDGGWNGYFVGSVPSQTFLNCTHAVIVDINLNVVHDPNPNKLALKCKPEDVLDVIVKGGWIIDLDRNFNKL